MTLQRASRLLCLTTLFLAACQPAATNTPAPAGNATLDPADALTPENLSGVFTRQEANGGAIYLTITPEGDFRLAIGSAENTLESGTYALDGSTLTLPTWDRCTDVGTYDVRLTGHGRVLVFKLADDACTSGRVAGLTEGPWSRVAQ